MSTKSQDNEQAHQGLTYEQTEAECDAWMQEEGLSFASPEAHWATKAYMKARGFDWPQED